MKRVEGILKEHGKKYDIVTRRELTRDIVDEFDLIVSAGGDGTVIAGAAYNKDVPQLNVRLDEGSVGALCHKDFEPALRSALEGKLEVGEWTRQDVYLALNGHDPSGPDGKFIGRALNETGVQEKGGIFGMAKYNFNGEYSESSGLVVVTGTGSTGWKKTFEGYSRDSKIFKYVSVLSDKGNEFGEGDNFVIEYKNHEGMFVMDTVRREFPRDSVLEIKLSKSPLRVLE